jgi:sulfate adenylyltransferase subunit 2
MSSRGHLRLLENESIHVLREVAAQFERPALLFSGGKDSIVVAWLARRAFAPARIPVPLLHIDTGHNCPETLVFRDRFAEQMDCSLIVRLVQDSIDRGRVKEEAGPTASRNALQTVTLLDAIKELQLDCAIGGARRDEEKARAKERVFSHRDYLGQWDPKNQRPELWNLYNGRIDKGESIRVFPLSNWTELDVWQYVHLENIPVVPLYFAKTRPVVERDGMLIMVDDERLPLRSGEAPQQRLVRFRTLGCYPFTGAMESSATSVADIIEEMLVATTSERQGRAIDHDESGSMEQKKKEGYF